MKRLWRQGLTQFKNSSCKEQKNIITVAELMGHSNDTWHVGEGGIRESVTKWHTGEGRGLPKCHVTFFNNTFLFWAVYSQEKLIFWKVKNITSHFFVFWPAFLKEKVNFMEIQNVTSPLGGSVTVSANDAWSKRGQKVSRIIWMAP